LDDLQALIQRPRVGQHIDLLDESPVDEVYRLES
jgi:hypothetical protein